MGTDAPLFEWLKDRGAGVLLHPTSFPGNQGVGTLDAEAIRFLDFLKAAGFTYWQVCPLGPTGYGDSPYQCFSAFAGNPYLVDLNALVAHRLLKASDLAPLLRLSHDRVDFGALYTTKWPLLFKAYQVFKGGGEPAIYGDYWAFKQQNKEWLEPYSLFMALKAENGGAPWWEWPAGERTFGDASRAVGRSGSRTAGLADRIESYSFAQYVFFGQWAEVRKAAAARGILIIGDIPIFVAADGADVWARPELFELDPSTNRPVASAGVPPDYFAVDGQLWGNPLYTWEKHSAEKFAWWHNRLKASFAICDVLRIDHFRGFESYWRVALPAKNARKGSWIPAPGLDLFRSIRATFPSARIIAEDLGLLTPEVVALRRQTGLPGMAVLQFAFGGKPDNVYLPHNLDPNSVIYPGTHDNDTTRGWYAKAPENVRDHVRRYFRVDGNEISWDFIRAAYASVARLAVIPLQDILSLDSSARFNSPGEPMGNWQWRYPALPDSAPYLRSLADLYGRLPLND